MNQIPLWIKNHLKWGAIIGIIGIICLNLINWQPGGTGDILGSYIFFFLWIIIFSGGCAYFAKEKNRNPWLWAWLGFVGGFFSLIVIICLKPK